MAKFLIAKKDYYLIPAWDEDKEIFNKLSQGEIVEAKTLSQRNLQFHRKYFKLLQIAVSNMPEHLEKYYPTVDILRQAIMFEIGAFETFTDLQGNIYRKAKSITFDKMEQEEFERIYRDTLDILLKYIFKDMSKEEFEETLLDFI